MKLFVPTSLARPLEYQLNKVPTPEDPLAYWYICPYEMNFSRGLVAILPALRFSAVLWDAPYYSFAGHRTVQGIRAVLRDPYYEIPQSVIDQYLPEDTDLEPCAAEDRGMGARMRAIAAKVQKMAETWYGYGPIDSVNIQRTMNSEDVQLANGETGVCWQAVKELLEQRYGRAVQAMEMEISLDLQKETVRRTLLVSAETSFLDLHFCLMAAFRWHPDTTHMFTLPAVRERKSVLHFIGGVPGQMFLPEKKGYKWDDADRISDYLQPGDRFQYQCPVSRIVAHWEMDLQVLRFLPPTEEPLPICTAAAGRVPPEDAGGVPGYLEFRRILAKPQDRRYGEMQKLAQAWPPEETPEEITKRIR